MIPINDTDDRLIRQVKIIKNNSKLTTPELVNLLNVSRITIKRDIEKLKELNKLKRKGTAKGGYWEIIE